MIDLDLINNLNRGNKFLFLNGYGIDIRVDDGKLIVKDGIGYKQIFFPKRFPFSNVVIYGTRGSISFEAIRWLIKHDTQISFINWNGKLLTTILPQETKQTKLKFAQYRAYESPKRIEIARKLIEAKIERSKAVLDWLKERYPNVNNNIEGWYLRLPKASSIEDIMMIEGRVAELYWKQLSKIFDKKFEFETRQYTNRPFGAVDPINALFNYGYALLESECRKVINSVGLDTHVGFLHEVTIGKEPLVYDLQEPFRFLVDLTIITSLEKEIFTKSDFIRTENYNLKLRPTGAKKLIKELELWFTKPVEYLGNKCHWSYLIFLKTRELARYLLGKKNSIDFSTPLVELERKDSLELRRKILDLSNSQARKLGIGKSELWYLKQNAKSDKPFKIYNKIEERLKI